MTLRRKNSASKFEERMCKGIVFLKVYFHFYINYILRINDNNLQKKMKYHFGKTNFFHNDIANQLYGKSIEKVKNRRSAVFVRDYWHLNRLQNYRGFKGFKIIYPSLVIAYRIKPKVKLQKENSNIT